MGRIRKSDPLEVAMRAPQWQLVEKGGEPVLLVSPPLAMGRKACDAWYQTLEQAPWEELGIARGADGDANRIVFNRPACAVEFFGDENIAALLKRFPAFSAQVSAARRNPDAAYYTRRGALSAPEDYARWSVAEVRGKPCIMADYHRYGPAYAAEHLPALADALRGWGVLGETSICNGQYDKHISVFGEQHCRTLIEQLGDPHLKSFLRAGLKALMPGTSRHCMQQANWSRFEKNPRLAGLRAQFGDSEHYDEAMRFLKHLSSLQSLDLSPGRLLGNGQDLTIEIIGPRNCSAFIEHMRQDHPNFAARLNALLARRNGHANGDARQPDFLDRMQQNTDASTGAPLGGRLR